MGVFLIFSIMQYNNTMINMLYMCIFTRKKREEILYINQICKLSLYTYD